MQNLLRDAAFVGFFRDLKGSKYIDLSGSELVYVSADVRMDLGERLLEQGEEIKPSSRADVAASAVQPFQSEGPKKVFIAHGKDRIPLDQLKKMLDQFKVKYAVAVDEPHQGRPISAKVASLMRDECSSAIFVFTADEKFLQPDDVNVTGEIWRPSENVVYELGAASVLYDQRIVIFKDKRVTFPSDFSDLGYIEFEQDQLVGQMANLFSELVALDILEVRAKA